MNMNGADAQTIHKARDLIAESIVTFTEHMKDEGIDGTQKCWNHTWHEFLRYAQRGERGGTAKENVRIREETDEIRVREPYLTLYPGEMVGNAETNRGIGRCRQKNMGQLTDCARNNEHRQERRNQTQREKRMRFAKGENGTKVFSDAPERKIGGGEWEMLPRQEDTTARRLLGGQDRRGTHRVFKDDTMELAHEKEYAGHPILRLFMRPEEMENGRHTRMSNEDINHMNGADGKKLKH
eukprot:872136-Pleurochrysis_carterae.AAC.4